MTKEKRKIIVTIDADLEDIVPRFLEIRQKNIISINGALKGGDYDAIVRIGHSMKGAGAGYGFDYITEIGNSIEDGAKIKDAEKIKRCVRELSDYLNNIEIVFC